MPDLVTAFAPATVANLNCGFDILGLALSYPGDRVTAKKTRDTGVRIGSIDYGLQIADDDRVPVEVSKNTAGIAAAAFLDQMESPFGVELSIHKELPSGSGLGSSASSAVAAVVAINALLDEPLPRPALLSAAMEAEKSVSGGIHADNIVPCLFGGLALIRSAEPLDFIPLPYPEDLYIALLTPRLKIETKAARSILPKKVTLENAVKQTASCAAAVAALYEKDWELLGRVFEDYLIFPHRKDLIPGCETVIHAARSSGAIAAGISGSGPTLFALVRDGATAHQVARVMKDSWKGEAISYVAGVHTKGAIVI